MMPRFISFEGGEGAGKTTQIARLARRLRALGHEVVETREPGGTPGAEAIRALVVGGRADRWTAETDALLMTAARADHVARLIAPALARGAILLCDRFVHSTLAYQGAGHGLDTELLRRLHRFACRDLWPDLTLWLDVPPEVGLARAAVRRGADADRFEAEAIGFHQRVHAAFAGFCRDDPAHVRRIDAGQPADAVEQAIARLVLPQASRR